MQNKRGFTLIELITVIAIVAVLGIVLIPGISGYAETSKDVVCNRNVNLLNRIYRQEVALYPNTTAQDILDNKNSQYYGGVSQCPNGGVYSVKSTVIVCNKHKSGGSSESNKFEGDLYESMIELLDQLSKCGALTTVVEQENCSADYYGDRFWNASHATEELFKRMNGQWDRLDPSIVKQAGLTGPLYVRPYFGQNNKEPIIFANAYNQGSGYWYGNMIYYGDSWYKHDKGFSMTDFNNMTAEQINLKIVSEFSKVE